MPLVSIIIPVYNTGELLRRAAGSALAQTYSEIELILVDDGSTDGSGALCDELAAAHAAVRVIHQANGGVSAARNAGIDAAAGEYLCFLDADDALMPDAVETLAASATGFDMIVGGYLLISGAEEREHRHSAVYSRDAILADVYGDVVHLIRNCWGRLFKTSILKEHGIRFDSRVVFGEDTRFVVDYLAHCETVRFVDAVLYHYYRFGEEERVSATDTLYPDFFEEYLSLFERRKEILGPKIEFSEKALFSFCDFMIIYLVRAAAYREFFTDEPFYTRLRTRLRRVVDHPIVRQAAGAYRPTRPTDSRLIPFFLKRGWTGPLYLALIARGSSYIKARGRTERVRSCFREAT